MAKTIFEQMNGTYTMQGDYCLPNLTLPPEEERHIGVWAQHRRQYLKQHHKILYYNCSLPVSFNHTLQMLRKKRNLFFFGWSKNTPSRRA